MRLLLILFFIFPMLDADDFITRMEYAKLLYSNPRGIGCDKCHGSDAKGAVIANIKVKGEVKKFSAPPIHNATKEVFFKALNKPRDIMPKYSLTDEEMESLYEYITKQL